MLYVLGSLLLLILVLVIRALLFRPREKQVAYAAATAINETRAVETFRQMIRCRTISYDDPALKDEAEFEKFRVLLDERYPQIAANCEKHCIEPAGIVYHWKGNSARHPWVLMAHYDVVPVEEDQWTENPFDAVIKDGAVWGRGTVDTKCTLLGVMEAVETLLEQGFTPQNDIYLCFGGDEELEGKSAQAIVKWFDQQGISPNVLDEGGAIVNHVFPGVSTPAAVIGTGEKGHTNFAFTLRGAGGHASSPAPHTPVGRMAKAICKIENHPFKAEMVPPVADLFNTLGRYAGFGMRLIFANLWCFKPLLFVLGKRMGGEFNALMRTTCAFTKMEGGTAWNVIPPTVFAGADVRLLNQTPEQAAQEFQKIIANDQIQIDIVTPTPPSPYSLTEGAAWDTLKEAVRQTWPGVIVTPYLMMAASDSRHYARISDRVYRFCPMEMPSEIRKTIHGHNERIPMETLLKIIAFYLCFIQKI
ncbi:MAG TPA: M20/M25/M40 family metallo-hydrolase [Candidatus Limiplasma sp.]|nr:M20/M25/M40 family metallo-hydrolase [Candidatus Limiplasma sp.]